MAKGALTAVAAVAMCVACSSSSPDSGGSGSQVPGPSDGATADTAGRDAAVQDVSQETLAERAHLHWTYVSGVERGRRTPGLDVIGRLASALGVTPAELFRPLSAKYRPRHRGGGRWLDVGHKV